MYVCGRFGTRPEVNAGALFEKSWSRVGKNLFAGVRGWSLAFGEGGQGRDLTL